MELDLWFDLALRGERDLQGDLLERLDLVEAAGPAPDPEAEAEPERHPTGDLF